MAVWNVVMSSQVDAKSRIDSEYFLPEYTKVERLLDRITTKKLPELFSVSDGNHLEVSKHFSNDKDLIPYYRGKDINDFFIENANPVRIPHDIYNSGIMRRSHFNGGDVLLSIVGTIGSLSVVPEDFGEATGSCKIAILRKRSLSSPYFLAAYLLSKYGQSQVKRNTRGAVQMGLILKDFVRIRVPVLMPELEVEIEELVLESIQKNKISKTLYTQAQDLLEQELELNKLILQKNKSYETSFTEVVENGRSDAEFYNPHAKEIYKLKCFSESRPLKEIFNILKGKTPSSYLKDGIPVLKTKNIRTPIIDEGKINDYAISSDKYTSTQMSDLIIASMGVGSLGRISYVFDDSTCAIIDGTLRILRVKEGFEQDIIPTLLFLTSTYGQILIYQGIVGSTGIISLPDYHLRNIKIPLLNTEIAKKLTSLVLDSYQAKQESDKLLQQAIRRVENLIEGVIK